MCMCVRVCCVRVCVCVCVRPCIYKHKSCIFNTHNCVSACASVYMCVTIFAEEGV